MSRRVIPAGDSLKDFHWAGGEADRIGAAYSSDPIRAWRAHRYPASQGESLPRASLFSGGDLPAPTSHNHIKFLIKN